ncbi:MAG: hypothetical protein DWI00_00650 [Planctomycetota bacterium]|nr:MAG: hypothetical protein DWI00_00650 [Planctomycetota bacterium]
MSSFFTISALLSLIIFMPHAGRSGTNKKADVAAIGSDRSHIGLCADEHPGQTGRLFVHHPLLAAS